MDVANDESCVIAVSVTSVHQLRTLELKAAISPVMCHGSRFDMTRDHRSYVIEKVPGSF